jgi:L-fuconolactonase
MPDFPLVDTHVHLWDPTHLRYPWLSAVPSLDRPCLLSDYRQACGTVAVDKMVFLQCECDPVQYQQEADWVTRLAQDEPRIEGIVPWAPLEKGEGAGPELDQLAGNPLVKGIRRIIQFEPDVHFCLQPGFVEGARLLADCNLHFEICIKGDEQFRAAIALVQKCPRTRFILDHIGKPFIKERIVEPWGSLMKELADLPNTWCKVSGLVTEANPESWTDEDLKPYIAIVLERFGFERTMFGGDWPVASQAAPYPRWVSMLESALGGASREQLQKLFRRNAIDFYRLSE